MYVFLYYTVKFIKYAAIELMLGGNFYVKITLKSYYWIILAQVDPFIDLKIAIKWQRMVIFGCTSISKTHPSLEAITGICEVFSERDLTEFEPHAWRALNTLARYD